MEKTVHISVMPQEVVNQLRASAGGEFLDCTLGGGGHTRLLLQASENTHVVACDRDQRAIERAQEALSDFSERVSFTHSSFSALSDNLPDQKFAGMLADLGVSTDQIKESRGFSFVDQSLDMRMDESEGISAEHIVNSYDQQKLFILFKEGGVGEEARRVAQAICRERPIKSAQQLAEVVSSVTRHSKKKIHPATLVFQALRIAVNDEFNEIKALLKAAPQLVQKGGRLVIVSFHSLEDKIVARTMREWEGALDAPAWWPGVTQGVCLGTLLTRKALVPGEEELIANPSARSARMRVFEFKGE